MNGMTLFDENIGRFRILAPDDHEIVEIKAREYAERLLELKGYNEEIRRPARIFISWIAGIRRDQPRTKEEAQMLADMVQRRESAILPNNMAALRVYADLVRIGSEVAAERIKMIEERTTKPFKLISNPSHTTQTKKRTESRAPTMRRVV